MAKDNGKSIGLDLSKFKHVSSDDKSHTLKHYEGHEIKLATNKLSKANREALKAMAEKSAAKESPKDNNEDAQMLSKGGQVRQQDAMKGGGSGPATISTFGSGKVGGVNASSAQQGVSAANAVRGSGAASPYGQVIRVPSKDKGYAEGGTVVPEAIALEPEAPAMSFGLPDLSAQGIMSTGDQIDKYPQQRLDFMKSQGYTDPMDEKTLINKLGQEKMARETGAENRITDEMAKSQAQYKDQSSLLQQKQALGIALTPEEQAIMAQGAPQGAMPQPGAIQPTNQAAQSMTPAAPQGGMQGAMGDAEGMMKSGYQNQLAGINAQAQAAGDLGKAQAEVLAKQQDAQLRAKAHYDETFSKLEGERNALMQDVQDGHIDPNKYWTGDKDGNGGHSKIMAGIGMILAGFNPTSAPNAAMNFLKYQMDQNLQAQTKNLDAKQNLLSANLRQFGNLKDATEMTRIMQNDMVASQLQQAAATAASPMAKAAALNAAGQLKMQTAPMFQQFAMRRAMMGMGQSGDPSDTAAAEQMIQYARMTNPEMAKEMEGRLVPGVGMAKIPVPTEIRNKLEQHKDMDMQVKDLTQFVKTHSTIIPGTPEYTVGAQKALALQSAVREGKLGTVYKEGEQPLLDKFVNSNPAGALKYLQTLPQLQELLQSNTRSMDVLKKSYGLPVSKQEAAPPQYKVVNGVKYMKGPDGKAIPVK